MQEETKSEFQKTIEILESQVDNVIPSNVVDKAAYKKWVQYKNSPNISLEYRRILTSDDDLIIDPFGSLSFNKKRILHLPQEEQELIIKRCLGYGAIQKWITSSYKKAFGLQYVKQDYDFKLEEREPEVLEMMGRMLSDAKIKNFMLQEWGFTVSNSALARFRNKHKNKIQSIQDEVMRNFNDIRLTHKKGRLEELVSIYHELEDEAKNASTAQNKEQRLKVIRAIKDEVEDPKLKIEATINGRIDIMVGVQIQNEVMKGMTINDIVVARAAAKLGVPPIFIISRLHSSFYANNTGFNGKQPSKDVAFLPNLIYNWTEIDEAHKAGTVEDTIEFEMVDDKSEIKRLLIEKLKDKQNTLTMQEQNIKSIDKGEI